MLHIFFLLEGVLYQTSFFWFLNCNKFLSNMSERARDLLLDDMEAKGPIRVSEVEAAQKAIMQIARKLSDDGEIMLAGAGEAFV